VSADDLVCGECNVAGTFSAPISVIVVHAPGLARPYPLIPEGEYRICLACDPIKKLVDTAVDAHPVTRAAGPWTRAVVVLDTGHGRDLNVQRAEQARA
jgi:hypothetical protein